MTTSLQICGSCNEAKPPEEFYPPTSHEKRCRSCAKLEQHARVKAAHAAGMTRRQWVRNVSAEARSEALAFWRSTLLQIQTNTPKEQPKKKAPKATFDHLALQTREHSRSMKKKIKEERAKLNNKQIDIKEGFIYAIVNPNMSEVSLGMTLSYEDRLKTYQRYDPHKRFSVAYARFVKNRSKAEARLHAAFKKARLYDDAEWFAITVEEAIKVMDEIAETS